ncbi:MAG TPA: hypothetical protein VHA78_00180 [Candidatus Peribacteraceae bacterium]|nr:hypothetical protein [Candidatus Peribacteraceae bacterium]
MDKIIKLLRRMNAKERDAMLLLMEQIKRDHTKVPGVKALQNMEGMFRVRIGQYRIIFVIDKKTKKAEIRRISRRNEKTYKDL